MAFQKPSRDTRPGQKPTAKPAYSDAGFLLERKRIQLENAKKTERLKALRLAKEAEDRLVAEKAALENPPVVKKRRIPPAAPVVASPVVISDVQAVPLPQLESAEIL